MKWYHFSQNNSGGSHTNNDDVGEDVFIQAESEQLAQFKFDDLDNDADNWCECCGERWYGSDEIEEPDVFGKLLSEGYKPFSSRSHAVVHYADGRKEIVKPF